MILTDLLIYGDWLEENDIKNSLYKQFLNLLRVKLRIEINYFKNLGDLDNILGGGYGESEHKGNGYGNGWRYNYGFMGKFTGNGGSNGYGNGFGDGDSDSYGDSYGYGNGNGKSI